MRNQGNWKNRPAAPENPQIFGCSTLVATFNKELEALDAAAIKDSTRNFPDILLVNIVPRIDP
jgi:hypothetical protein